MSATNYKGQPVCGAIILKRGMGLASDGTLTREDYWGQCNVRVKNKGDRCKRHGPLKLDGR